MNDENGLKPNAIHLMPEKNDSSETLDLETLEHPSELLSGPLHPVLSDSTDDCDSPPGDWPKFDQQPSRPPCPPPSPDQQLTIDLLLNNVANEDDHLDCVFQLSSGHTNIRVKSLSLDGNLNHIAAINNANSINKSDLLSCFYLTNYKCVLHLTL